MKRAAALLVVVLMLSGCATWCRMATGSVTLAEGLVERWTAIAHDSCVPPSDRCEDAGKHLARALAALIAARAAAIPCEPEDLEGVASLAPTRPDVDLEGLEVELRALKEAAEAWEVDP